MDGESTPAAGGPIRRPTSDELRRGGRYGRHVRPSRPDDDLIRTLVEYIFAPRPPAQPEDPHLVEQLLQRAPQPDQIGVNDWERPLRADELAEVWGEPIEGPDTRTGWLRRADEVARAWGRPLFGAGGLRPDITLPD